MIKLTEYQRELLKEAAKSLPAEDRIKRIDEVVIQLKQLNPKAFHAAN